MAMRLSPRGPSRGASRASPSRANADPTETLTCRDVEPAGTLTQAGGVLAAGRSSHTLKRKVLDTARAVPLAFAPCYSVKQSTLHMNKKTWYVPRDMAVAP